MKPSEVEQHLGAFADGELDERTRAAVAAHVARDAAARAEVERWRALRRCAQRGLAAEMVPMGLHERVLEGLARARPARSYRRWSIVGGCTAAAAVLVLVVLYGLPGPGDWGGAASGGPVVLAADLAKIYHECACLKHEDAFGVAGKPAAEAARLVAARPEVDFPVHVPDFSVGGYQLAGVCHCCLAKGVRSVHAHYVRGAYAAGQPSDPDDVVSFFSMDCLVELGSCAEVSASGRDLVHPRRNYVVARTDDGVTVLKWDERACSLAACSKLEQAKLVRVVDAADVAALLGPSAPAVAAAPGAIAVGVAAVIGLVCIVGMQATRG